MRLRAPGSEPLVAARLDEHRLTFESNEPPERTPSFFPNVRPQGASSVAGAVYRLTEDDLVALDAYEDVAAGVYERALVEVACEDGTRRSAVVYRMAVDDDAPQSGAPSARILSEMRAGYAEWGLDATAIDRALRPKHGSR